MVIFTISRPLLSTLYIPSAEKKKSIISYFHEHLKIHNINWKNKQCLVSTQDNEINFRAYSQSQTSDRLKEVKPQTPTNLVWDLRINFQKSFITSDPGYHIRGYHSGDFISVNCAVCKISAEINSAEYLSLFHIFIRHVVL